MTWLWRALRGWLWGDLGIATPEQGLMSVSDRLVAASTVEDVVAIFGRSMWASRDDGK